MHETCIFIHLSEIMYSGYESVLDKTNFGDLKIEIRRTEDPRNNCMYSQEACKLAYASTAKRKAYARLLKAP
jgi:hypothetical protein